MGRLGEKIKKIFKMAGPGFITGAADDDPSGIATYSIAGAQFGYKMSWMTLFLIPAMVAIQEMCGRIGMMTGMGLANVIKKYQSKSVMWFAISLLLIANVINIGADLGIMAASLEMIFGLPYYFWLVIVAVGIVLLEVFVSYRKYSNVLKWLGLSLTVYVVTAFLVKQDWQSVAFSTLVPQIDFSMAYIMTMVGFLGTTISPYLFFWQASEEVEEEICDAKVSDFNQIPKVSGREIRRMKFDTILGMVFSNVMTFFVILTTAATLHANGIFEINSAQDAAMALKPLAGDFAYLLFTLGIVGIGLQSIPVLAGGVAYAFSDALNLSEGLSKKWFQARGFYLIIIMATFVGMILNFIGINTIQALYLAGIVNGVVAVPLIAIIIRLADNPKVVGTQRTNKWLRLMAWMVFVFMAAAAILMIVNLFRG